MLVSAVDPQGSGVKCYYMSPPDVSIITGRMTVHTQLNVTLWWLTQVRRSKGGREALHPPLPKCWGMHPPIPRRWRPCLLPPLPWHTMHSITAAVCWYNCWCWYTCDDWYTNGYFCCFDYQDCTNSQKQSNSKNDHWCTNHHMSTQIPPNTQRRLTLTVHGFTYSNAWNLSAATVLVLRSSLFQARIVTSWLPCDCWQRDVDMGRYRWTWSSRKNCWVLVHSACCFTSSWSSSLMKTGTCPTTSRWKWCTNSV